jgi:beta-N-acetylhexosaminidase
MPAPTEMPGARPLQRSDVRAAAGRMIICGFDGTSVTAELKEVLREVQPLGLILFARNIESVEHVTELVRELKMLRKDEPLLVSVDQEGGRVQRIRAPATVWPAMRKLGAIDDEALTQRVGEALGRELRAMNFDIDYAPVLDVDTNPKNPVIGDRSFGASAKAVTKHAIAFMKGLNAAGVGGCGKHFPGHGDTDLDSHLALPKVEHELPRLRETEWPPFKLAIKAGLDAIMTAHVVVAALDEKVPATFSKKALDTLRSELSFRGIIISDDIEMKAVADHHSATEMARLGLAAGIDVFLSCKRYEATLELFRGIVQQVESNAYPQLTLIETDKRIRAWRDRWWKAARPYADTKQVIGTGEHQDMVALLEARYQAG